MSSTESIVARFDVTGWDPVFLPGVEGNWAAGLTMRKTYTAGILGEAVLHFVSSGTEETGQAYLAVERITGRLEDARTGSLTLHHGALQNPNGQDGSSAFGYIIPGSGTGDFAAFAGRAEIGHDADGAYLSLHLVG